MSSLDSMDFNTTVGLSDLYPYDLLDQDKANFEKTLNVLGYIPGISTASGGFRALSGVVNIVISAVKASFLLVADLFMRHPHKYPYRAFKHITYAGHGVCNVVRGIIECIPLIGNISCFVYDGLIGRVSYAVESTGPHYVILKTS